MIISDYTSKRLKKFKNIFDLDFLQKYYDQPHRFYHNWDHIENLISLARKFTGIIDLNDDLFLAIVFHDIIYDPKQRNNENRSAELFYSLFKNDTVRRAILDTENHSPASLTSNIVSINLNSLDMHIMGTDIDYKTFIDYEHKIFKEYQWVDYDKYKEERIKILKKYNAKLEFINYVKYREPKIAVYPGSFNPFHLGHMNILKKAEQIFDKVIIARGVNSEKTNNKTYNLPNAIFYHQIEKYDGLLTDFIDSLRYNVTVIRGLRNSNDLDYELTQYRYLQDLKPNISVVSIFCDKEYEHISSSAIKTLEKFNKHTEYLP